MNKWLGILIIILYFSNCFICEAVHPIDNEQWFRLKYGILTIVLYLALEYKPQDNFIEKFSMQLCYKTLFLFLKMKILNHSTIYLKCFKKEYVLKLYNNENNSNGKLTDDSWNYLVL